MDINDNQQINTFVKGMNTDVSDALMSNDQYRYAENIRIVTNTDSNSGEVRIVDGTTPFQTEKYPWESILAMTSIRDYVVVIAKCLYGDSLYSEDVISIFVKDTKKGEDWKRIVNSLPYEEFVQADGEPHFSLVPRWESDNNVKLYIADGIHSIFCINITKDYSNGGQFNTVQDIIPYTNTSLYPPTILISEGGQLMAAKVQYAYRLYNMGEPATNMSPLSLVYSLYDGDNKGYGSLELTTKQATITIPKIASQQENITFEKLQIYRITYVQLGQLSDISLVYDGDVVSSYTDTGVSVEGVDVADFMSMQQLLIIPSVIESKEDYLFAANIKYRQDQYDKELEELGLDFRSYSSGDFNTAPSIEDAYDTARDYNKQYSTSNTNYDVLNWTKPWNKSVLGGIGPIVSWEYSIKNIFVDEENTPWDIISYAKDIPNCIKHEKGDIKSLRKGEVYRYGIILYKEDGTKSSVNWIADIMIPDKEMPGYLPDLKFPSGYNSFFILNEGEISYGWEFSVIGIKFSVRLNAVQLGCVGYEIVRCKRGISDLYTISLGIIGFPEETNDTLYQPPFITTQSISERTKDDNTSLTNNKYLLFSSPEYVYQSDDVLNVIKLNKSNIYVENICSYYNDSMDPIYVGHKISTGETIDFWYSYLKGVSMKKIMANDHSMALWLKFINEDGVPVCNTDRLRSATFFDSELQFKQSREYDIRETCINNVVAEKELSISCEKSNIKNFAFPEVPLASLFFDGNDIPIYRDAITPIGNINFNSWSTYCDLNREEKDDKDAYEYYKHDGRDHRPQPEIVFIGAWEWEPAGTCGKEIIFELQNERTIYKNPVEGSHEILAPITVANLRKSAIPYGGPSSYKQDSLDYISHGYYAKITPYDTITTTDINVFDGDCYPGIFIYNATHAFDNSVLINKSKVTTIYYVPVESHIDLRATYGDLYTRVYTGKEDDKSYYIQDTAGSVDGFVQSKDAYLYNTAYNAEPDSIQYSSTTYETIYSNNFDYRVHHSELKTNGEHIDSWSEFKSHNYIDVDTRYGEITNMRLFKGKLLFWQNNSTGILSVNERTVLNDVDENQIVLGTGGVLQRYDYISTIYGMRPNQYEAEVQSNTTQYWWDGNNKEILAYAGEYGTTPLTKIKNISNYINSHVEVKHPSLSYDIKYNELISNVVGSGSLSYNEQVQQFTSVYTFTPIYRCNINNNLLLTDSSKIYNWNNSAEDESMLFDKKATPKIRYVVNNANTYVKTFDIVTFGGRFYQGDDLNDLTFTFDTPLKQHSSGTGNSLITNREYDFRLDIPRNNNSSYGDRMRGKTMQCELSSSSNSTDFSLQYIITKYRMSWS